MVCGVSSSIDPQTPSFSFISCCELSNEHHFPVGFIVLNVNFIFHLPRIVAAGFLMMKIVFWGLVFIRTKNRNVHGNFHVYLHNARQF